MVVHGVGAAALHVDQGDQVAVLNQVQAGADIPLIRVAGQGREAAVGPVVAADLIDGVGQHPALQGLGQKGRAADGAEQTQAQHPHRLPQAGAQTDIFPKHKNYPK